MLCFCLFRGGGHYQFKGVGQIWMGGGLGEYTNLPKSCHLPPLTVPDITFSAELYPQRHKLGTWNRFDLNTTGRLPLRYVTWPLSNYRIRQLRLNPDKQRGLGLKMAGSNKSPKSVTLLFIVDALALDQCISFSADEVLSFSNYRNISSCKSSFCVLLVF